MTHVECTMLLGQRHGHELRDRGGAYDRYVLEYEPLDP